MQTYFSLRAKNKTTRRKIFLTRRKAVKFLYLWVTENPLLTLYKTVLLIPLLILEPNFNFFTHVIKTKLNPFTYFE